MKPSKRKSKNRKAKSPQIEASSPIDPGPQLSSSESPLAPSETLNSTSQSRSGDLAWLFDVFSSLSVDQIESAYNEAGCDPFKAAGILGTHLEEEALEQDRRITGPTVSEASSQKKLRKARPRRVAVSCGMVSTVIGKVHESPRSKINGTNIIQGDVELKKNEEAEEFLCSMLGEESDLGLGVVRDILGVCRGDVEKALDLLLELSDPSYRGQVREQFIPSEKNGLNYSHIFHGMGCKNTPGSNTTPLQLGNQGSSLTYFQSDRENDLFFERPKRDTQPMEPRQSKLEIEQKVLKSLFNVHEERQMRMDTHGHMDWRKVVKKLQNGLDFQLHSRAMPASWQKPQDGKRDGYHEFRTVAQQNWDMMKTYYQRAALEYSRGNRGHASCLAEKGNYYRDLAREEDERASIEIFGSRNQGIKNTVTIDLHGQHVKQAIGLLKRHLLLFACIPSVHCLRVITGCGEDGVGKGKMKRSVKNLATREKIDWSEENSGTIMLNIEGRKEYTFSDCDSDEE